LYLGHKGTRYEAINTWPQCKKCNKWLNGNHAAYRDRLILLIGRDGVAELDRTKDILPFDPPGTWRDWCIDTIIYSNGIIKELQKRIGDS
jgi:hypothetical protein